MSKAAFRTILVADENPEAVVAALDKVAVLEHFTGAAVRAGHVFHDAIADDRSGYFSDVESKAIVEKVIETQRQRLEDLVAPQRQHIADLSACVIWNRSGAAGIVAEARAISASLIVKPLAKHRVLQDYLHAPIDWQIMRDAPCPVLFTRRQPWADKPRLLAALDVVDKAHSALNRAILEHAKLFSEVLDAKLHLVTAYPDFRQYPSQYQVASDFEGIKADMRTRRVAMLETLSESLGMTAAELHVLEGRPRDAICDVAKRIDAQIVVLGTSARKGLKKLFIGNTAEDVIGHLGTDLLTVRATPDSR